MGLNNMTAQDLKNSILQQAVQGKLIPQNPDDEPATELLKKISAERQKLIDEGKIKNSPPLPPISDEEKPFDIPDTWQWVRLGNIVYNRKQKKPDKKFSYIDIGSINNIQQRLNEQENILNTENAPSRARKPVQFGDVIYSTVRPYLHNIALIDKKFSCESIASTGFAAMVCYECLFNKYLLHFLISPTFDKYANAVGNSKGIAYPAINDKTFYNAVLPLPPFAEQKRIVAKLEEILPLIERYGELEQRLTTLDKEFPDKLKKSLLQQAIQGKLTKQLSTDGNAKDLLKKIQAEKLKLVAEGKIKKEKPLPPISADEIPFEIPENWCWVRLGDICKLITKGSSPKWQGINYANEGILFITSENVGCERLILNKEKYVETKFNTLHSSSILQFGDVLTNIVGASIGRTAEFNLDTLSNINQAVALIRLIDNSLSKYIVKYLNSPAAYQIMMNDKVDTARANISLTNIANFLVPLPPLAEQKRIVEKLEELLPLCEKLQF